MIWTYFILFISGLCLGSFLSVVFFRLDRHGGIILGRSRCHCCDARLKWCDLIPILSFIFLRGQCRYCRERISWVYPVLELSTALITVAYFLVWGFRADILFWYYLVMTILFLLLMFFDILYLILPDKIVFSVVGLALIYNLIFRKYEFFSFLLFSLILGLFFAILYVASNGRWMGFGDVKLVFGIGLVLGYPLGLFTVLISIWSAALVGISLVTLKRATLKTALPFGSFLSGAALIFIIFQNAIEEKINALDFFF